MNLQMVAYIVNKCIVLGLPANSQPTWKSGRENLEKDFFSFSSQVKIREFDKNASNLEKMRKWPVCYILFHIQTLCGFLVWKSVLISLHILVFLVSPHSQQLQFLQ